MLPFVQLNQREKCAPNPDSLFVSERESYEWIGQSLFVKNHFLPAWHRKRAASPAFLGLDGMRQPLSVRRILQAFRILRPAGAWTAWPDHAERESGAARERPENLPGGRFSPGRSPEPKAAFTTWKQNQEASASCAAPAVRLCGRASGDPTKDQISGRRGCIRFPGSPGCGCSA